MNLREQQNLSDESYGLLFDIHRSIRYHEYRCKFYQNLHDITSVLTILMAGSVLYDLAKEGDTDKWLVGISTIAGILAVLDMVIGYANCANLHNKLRERFIELETNMISGDDLSNSWSLYQQKRLSIEKDEPAVYVVLDSLCRNELLIAEGFTKQKNPDQFCYINFFCNVTRNLLHWQDVSVRRLDEIKPSRIMKLLT